MRRNHLRVQLDLTEQGVKKFDELQKRLDVASRKELMLMAVDVMTWICDQRSSGRVLVATNGVDPDRELNFIGLSAQDHGSGGKAIPTRKKASKE